MSEFQGPPPHLSPSPRSRRFVVVAVVAGLILVNSIGFLAYRSIKAKDDAKEKPTAAVTADPAAAAAAIDETSPEGLIRAYRAIGLQSMEDGDFDRAVDNLGKAVEMGGTGDIPKLLSIAKDMQALKAGAGGDSKAEDKEDETEVAAREPETPAEPTKVAVAKTESQESDDRSARSDSASKKRKKRPKKVRRPPRRVAAATPRAAEEKAVEAEAAPEPEPEPPKPGILLVTSTPAKMIVAIDGKRVDVTPARITKEPGTYQIALIRSNETMYSRTVTIEPGEIESVNKDLTDAVAAQEARIAAKLERESQPEPPKKTPVTRRAPPRPTPQKEFGELHILSPNVYGEIYINKKKRGFPPLVVKNIPVGTATVEIRVQGKTRRAKRVRVGKDERTQVRFR